MASVYNKANSAKEELAFEKTPNYFEIFDLSKHFLGKSFYFKIEILHLWQHQYMKMYFNIFSFRL